MSPTVAVIDLGTSNMGSLTSALAYLGVSFGLVTEPTDFADATHVVLPGVGAFDAAMAAMRDRDLEACIRDYAGSGRPLLGVCLGMQLLFDGSSEGSLPGIGIVPGTLARLSADPGRRFKVPHVGFSAISGHEPTGLFEGLPANPAFYFTHSYALTHLEGGNVSYCRHTHTFVAAFQRGRVCGAQFHPEKSQSNGLRLLSNFLQFA
jgi:glutamine amidotransferase